MPLKALVLMIILLFYDRMSSFQNQSPQNDLKNIYITNMNTAVLDKPQVTPIPHYYKWFKNKLNVHLGLFSFWI